MSVNFASQRFSLYRIYPGILGMVAAHSRSRAAAQNITAVKKKKAPKAPLLAPAVSGLQVAPKQARA
jgi:hypothetical protein